MPSRKIDPLPENVTARDLALLLGTTTSNINILRKRGVLANGVPGVWPLAPNVHAYMRWQRHHSDRGEIEAEKVRGLKLKNDKLSGDLIPVEKASDIMMVFAQTVRSNIDGVPGRMASELASINDAAVVRARLREELAIAFNAAAESLRPIIQQGRKALGDQRNK